MEARKVNLPIIQTEDELLALIGQLVGPKIKVQSIAFDLNNEELLKRFTVVGPSVLLASNGGEVGAASTDTSASLAWRWTLFVAVDHANDELKRRRGDATGPGVYQLLDLLIPALHNTSLNESSVKVIAVQNIFDGKLEQRGLTVYSITIETPITWPDEVDETLLHAFTTLSAKYDMPPHDNAETRRGWLLDIFDAGVPDARDDIKPDQT